MKRVSRKLPLATALAGVILPFAAGSSEVVPGSLPALLAPLPNVEVTSAGLSLDLSPHFGLPGVTGPVMRVDTTLGAFHIVLLPETAPATVANFQAYAAEGAYANALVHRSMPGFIIQTGGFTATLPPVSIPAYPPVANEFQVSNTRGTLAMAKLGGNPDSATSQWFINLADNSANLDFQNGGFTVFAKVLGTGMEVADAIAAVPVYNAGSPYDNLPLRDMQPGQAQVQPENLIAVQGARPATILPGGGPAPSVLEFSLVNPHPARVTAALSGSTLHLSSVTGNATILVRATDANGNYAESSLRVFPPVRASVAGRLEHPLDAWTDTGSVTRVTGLPAGLSFDPASQTLSGFPSRAGTYQARALVVGADGASRWERFLVVVDPIPTWMRGSFSLVMARGDEVGGGLGGALTVQVGASGAASGRLSLAGLALPFRGFMERVSEEEGRLVVEIPARRGLAEPLLLETRVFPGHFAEGSVTGSAGPVALGGWRQTWHATSRPLGGERLGQMNLLLDLTEGTWAAASGAVPRGTGWARARTTRNGQASLLGRLADGTAVSGGMAAGPEGELAAWRPLYRNQGSLLFEGGITEQGRVEGSGAWCRPASGNPRQRVFREGFGQGPEGPVDLAIEGGRWQRPAAGEAALGLPFAAENPQPNAWIAWEEGGLEESATEVPELPLIFDGRHRALLVPGQENPAAATARLNAATGQLTLSIVLRDGATRRVSHSLLLAPGLSGGRLGGGYLMVPQLPDPEAEPPVTRASSPILSGKATLRDEETAEPPASS